MAQNAKPGRIDGRTVRGQRTRAKLIDAALDLVLRGERKLTAPTIAAAAGVSIRSLFQHFPDLETLWVATADRSFERILPLVDELPHDGPLEQRLIAFLGQRVEVLEMLTPMRRAAGILAPHSDEMQLRLDNARQIGRREIDQVFARELAPLDPARRRDTTDLVEVVTSWATWDQLRRAMGLTMDESSARVEHLLRGILTPR